MVSPLGIGMLFFVFLALLTFSRLTLQDCVDSSFFGGRIAQSGYATCHLLDYQKHNLLYITGFQRKMGSHNDLRDIKNAKCCQPPDIHKGKPHTCTSADWDWSFSRYVAQKNTVFYHRFQFFVAHRLSFFSLKLPFRKASAHHIYFTPEAAFIHVTAAIDDGILITVAIAHVRYITIQARLRGFRVKIANFSSFFCP